MYFRLFLCTVLATILLACGSDPEPEPDKTPVPTVKTSKAYSPQPRPVVVRQCEVTKTTYIKDCTLYDLMCDDGETDMVFVCPPTYWDRGEYIPLPP